MSNVKLNESGKSIKKNATDYAETVKEKIPHCEKLVKDGKVKEALEILFALEKQTRTNGDSHSTTKVLISIVKFLFESGNIDLLNESIVQLCKHGNQLKSSMTKMIHECCTYVDLISDYEKKTDYINTLLSVTDGEIDFEHEHTKLTYKLAHIYEAGGKISEAASLMQDLQDDTYDALNDETFGDCVEGDWETEHEKLIVNQAAASCESSASLESASCESALIERPMRAEELEAMLQNENDFTSSNRESFSFGSSPQLDSTKSNNNNNNNGWSPFGSSGFHSNISQIIKETNVQLPHQPQMSIPVIRPSYKSNRYFYPSHHQQQQQQTQQHHYNHQQQHQNILVDKYAGLMQQKDKEYIIKIQKRQLNFEDPYKEDYYYTTMCSRSAMDAATNNSDKPSLIIPERGKRDLGPNFLPPKFEGSLGKLQISNINYPRKLLDISKNDELKNEDKRLDNRPPTPLGRPELNRFRKLLLDIENLYCVLLEIDELDKKMAALPLEARKPLIGKRSDLCTTLYEGIYDTGGNCLDKNITSVRKGCELIYRSLQVLDDDIQKSNILAGFVITN